MPPVETLAAALAGLALGALAGWWLRTLRRPASDRRLEAELRAQLAAREAELREARAGLSTATSALAGTEARLEEAVRQSGNWQARADALAAESARLRQALAGSDTELATARAGLESARQLLAEQRRIHDRSEQEARENHARALADLKQAFTALSADALRQNAPEFLRLAQESLARFHEGAKGDLATREERIATLVRPLEEHLKAYQQRLQQAESGQAAALGEVRRHLEDLTRNSATLSGETQRLRRVLGSNQARGRWGEETLRRVVEAAGMSPHCDFTEQVRDGDAQPDLVVRLPGDRLVVVDAKVPDLDFLDALDATDTSARKEALAAHASKLRTTIRALADRNYPTRFPAALDHVVLFLPAESLFSAALEGDPNLIVWAAERRILLATPASLIALLRSVAVSWQQHEQSQNAREIAAAARTLFERVTRFVDHFERIRDGIARTALAYDDALGSYERRVRPAGDRLIRLGAGVDGKEWPAIPSVESRLPVPAPQPEAPTGQT